MIYIPEENQEENKEEQGVEKQKNIIDWDKYKEADELSPKPGDKAEGVVIDLRKGKIKELLPEEVLEKWKTDPEVEAVEVVIEYEWNGMHWTKKKLLTLPQGDVISKKSNLYKWKKTFGDYPRIGQRVFLIADSEGYFQIKL